MFQALRRSIRAKVMLLVMATTFVALLFSGVTLVLYDLRSHQSTWVNDMVTQAEIVARASAPSLAFDDSLTAHQNLALLSVRPQIMAAALFRPDGSRFASYRREGFAEPLPTGPEGAGHRIEGHRFTLFLPVSDRDERLGVIYLAARYDLRQRLVSYLAIVEIVLIASLLVALFMSFRLQSAVTRPILSIADVARRIKEQRDYSLRAPKTTEDETGDLVQAFNEMLGEVGRRTDALEGTNRRLEHEMKERQEAERALREADQRKDEFLATLAHELRNPLGPIRNAVHYLKLRGAGEPDGRRTLDIVERQVQSMVRLIEDLLDISRITRDALELRLATFPLADLLQDVTESCQHAVEEAGHELRLRAPAQPVLLHGDRARLAQAVTNLVNNAIKYTPRGGRVELGAASQGNTIEITVSDSGIGIPPDKLTDIFQPFSQLDRSLEKTRGGLGIGLALSQRLVALHGGTITASSEGPGHGSRFTVRLPIVTTAAKEAEKDGDAPLPSGHKLRVLVADDNLDAAESLAMLLQVCGYESATAPDGEEAFATASTGRFDAAILDIGMPRLNGYDLARRIRTRPWGRNMLLVALTGWGQTDDKERAFDAGFDDHLTKPVHPDQLLAALSKVRATMPG